MKVLIVLALVSTCLAFPQRQQQIQQDSPLLKGELPLEEEVYPPQPYEFGLSVHDDASTNYQARQEVKGEDGVVRGQYSYVGPDAIRYTYTYTADAINGYQVSIQREQTDIEIVTQKPYVDPKKPIATKQF